jgi:hypothetical protein
LSFIAIDSSAVKTHSLLHISDTFPYKLSLIFPPPIQTQAHWFLQRGRDFYHHTLTNSIPVQLFKLSNMALALATQGQDQFILSTNLPSANNSTDTLDKDISNQRAHNRLIPIPNPKQLKRFICSPLGLVPKPGQTDTWRRIHHLSSPPGKSVNDHIPSEWGALEYASFDEAIDMVAAAGQGAILIKRDLADAFRHIPVASDDHWLLGFCWDGAFWTDSFLPFGLRTSPFIFDLFAKGLHFLLEAHPSINRLFSILHYLDDFFAAGLPGANPTIYESRFSQICTELGLPIKESKSITGTTADYGGIEFDTLAMEARLPPAKLLKAKKLLSTLWPKHSTTLLELQSLIGYLSFCSKVVPMGRSFLRRLYNAATPGPQATCSSQRQPIPVTDDIRQDLRWWREFLPQWNGITLIHKNRTTKYLWTDASGTKGQGAYFTDNPKEITWWTGSKHSLRQSPDTTGTRYKLPRDAHSAPRPPEMAHTLADCRLIIHTDNTTVFSGLRRHSVRGSAMEPLRNITLCAAHHDIEMHAKWIPTHENTLADLLSRRDFNKIADQFPLLAQEPSHGTHRSHGTQILASTVQPPATSGGDSAQIPDEPTIQHAAAT